MMNFVNNIVDEHRIKSPIISSFYANELSARLAQYFHYYSGSKLINYRQILGNSLGSEIDTDSVQFARDAIMKSDIIFYNIGDWNIDWIPANKNYKELRDGSNDLLNNFFCTEGEVFDLPWGELQLYFRPKPVLNLATDKWWTSDSDITIFIDEKCLNKFSNIVIKGTNNRIDLKEIMIDVTYYKNENEIGKREIIFSLDNLYKLVIPLKINNNLPDAIKFDSKNYLIPCETSESSDCRKLLIFNPSEIEFE